MRFESRFIYSPTRHPAGRWRRVAAEANADGVAEVFFDTADGVRLGAWYCRAPAAGEPAAAGRRPVVLWLHGNAGNVTDRYEALVALARELACDVLIPDYRGYGKSGGRPSERGLYRDARAAWKYLIETRGVTATNIAVLGKSLGGAPAAQLAVELPLPCLIVQSSFTSIPDMAQHVMPFVPRFLVRHRMDSAAKLATTNCPKLFLHGRRDRVIPFAVGQALFDAAAEPKAFFVVPDAGHNDLEFVAGQAYYTRLRECVEAHCRP